MFRILRSLAILSALAALQGCNDATAIDTTPAPASAACRLPVNAAADIQATEALRRTILADPTMSVDARNIFIAAKNGNMLLRGAVQDDGERAKIKETAGKLPGVKVITDELQLPAQDPESIAGSPTGQGGDNVQIRPQPETGR